RVPRSHVGNPVACTLRFVRRMSGARRGATKEVTDEGKDQGGGGGAPLRAHSRADRRALGQRGGGVAYQPQHGERDRAGTTSRNRAVEGGGNRRVSRQGAVHQGGRSAQGE